MADRQWHDKIAQKSAFVRSEIRFRRQQTHEKVYFIRARPHDAMRLSVPRRAGGGNPAPQQ